MFLRNPVDCNPLGYMEFSRQEYWRVYHFLLQGIFLTQGSNPRLSHLLHWQVGSLPLTPCTKPFRMDREAWRAAIHGVAKSRTQLSDWSDLIWLKNKLLKKLHVHHTLVYIEKQLTLQILLNFFHCNWVKQWPLQIRKKKPFLPFLPYMKQLLNTNYVINGFPRSWLKKSIF